MPDARPVTLLSSGNPQIAKGDGPLPVAQYIAAMPGWKQAIGERLDHLVHQALPEVRLAVRWNTPLYGNATGWFFAFYCYKAYVQLSFFEGTSLPPPPPKASKTATTRYVEIREDGAWDQAQIADWIAQASRLHGVALW